MNELTAHGQENVQPGVLDRVVVVVAQLQEAVVVVVPPVVVVVLQLTGVFLSVEH